MCYVVMSSLLTASEGSEPYPFILQRKVLYLSLQA